MQVLSSLSGITFYAPSAGFAPTNSSDVSAIASSYQVVSATATQLYAGTAYVTSVNDAPISASRAGNAANASLATSAYYDGTGRLISSLPDSAAVSSIASSYAESAVSSKLDSSAASVFYTTANESGFVDSSYVDSAVSSKQDKLTFGFDDSNNISSIDGSALAGGGGGGLEYGATAAYGSNKLGLGASGAGTRTDAGLFLSSTNGTGFYKVNEMTLNRSSYGETVNFNLGSAGSQVRLSAAGTRGAFHSAWNDSASASFGVSGESAYLQLGPSTAYDTSIDAWNDTYSTVASNSATWGGGGGGIDSATCSAIASAYAESAVSSYVPYSSLEYNTASAISGINGSALAAGSTYSAGEGIDITDDVISVETPVDIVAGPGIVIDNPDGNTLRVSQYDPTVDVVRDCENWNGHSMKSIILRGAYTTNTSMQNQYIDNVLPVGTTIAFIDGSNSYVVYGDNPQINMMVPYHIDNNRLFSPWVDITNRRVNLRYIDVSNSITCTYYLCVKYAVD